MSLTWQVYEIRVRVLNGRAVDLGTGAGEEAMKEAGLAHTRRPQQHYLPVLQLR